MAICILCQAEAGPGVSQSVYGVRLFPLCGKCAKRCYQSPNDVVTMHPQLFDESQRTADPAISPSEEISQAEPSAQLTGGIVSRHASAVIKRYRDAYRVARATVSIGSAIKVIGVVIGVVLALIIV